MIHQPVLINGEWRQSRDPAGFFRATDPATGTPLAHSYPVSSQADIEQALQAAQEAVAALRSIPAESLAAFLDSFASKIEERVDSLVDSANSETALAPEPRLRLVELPRTSDQLRQAAAAARERTWCQATIDTKSNIRSRLGPLGGPVVVFGPNNFPFAFNSVSGGDFAAAIAAGNPVIAKANTGHPNTTRILAEAALDVLRQSDLPQAMIQLLYHTEPETGLALVTDERVGATAFTGSRDAGLKLKKAADSAGKLIYLEMSSVNPVFVLPGALRERCDEIATELYSSCAMGSGQFCTKPGLTIIEQGLESGRFIERVRELFEENNAGNLLSASGVKTIAGALSELQTHGAEVITGGGEAEGPGFVFTNTLLVVSGDDFLKHPHALQTEAFGTVNLIVIADDVYQMADIAARLEGNLTGCIYSHSQADDEAAYAMIEPVLRQKVGRLLNDKMPTGVAVVPSMNHGGPYPATGHPGFTAVGIPASLHRFAALHCYDNVRHHRLPAELQDRNPTGKMWRLIDADWTQGDVAQRA